MVGSSTIPPNGGPADTDVTKWVEDRANELLREENKKRKARAVHYRDGREAHARKTLSCLTFATCGTSSTWTPSAAGLKLGVDPLGGAAVHYWERSTKSTSSTSRS